MTDTQACEVCGAHVVDLRRGRCFGCYEKWIDTRPVGIGAACGLCDDRRKDNLRTMELHGAWVPLCYNCAGRALRLRPFPRTLDAIRLALARERRAADRRGAIPDVRPQRAERRGLERRSVGLAVGGDLLLDEVLVELL